MSFVAVAALIAGLAQPVDAKPEHGGLGKKIEGLAPDQQVKAKALMDEIKSSNAPIKEAIKTKRGEIDALMQAPNPDKMQLEKLSKDIGELRGKLLTNRVEMKGKFEAAGIKDFPKGKGGKDMKKPGKPVDMANDNPRLEQLTQEQQDQAKQIYAQSKAVMDPIRENIRAKQGEINTVMGSENPDVNRIQSLSIEVGELKGKMLGARVDLHQNLLKAGIPADLFDKPAKADKKGARMGK